MRAIIFTIKPSIFVNFTISHKRIILLSAVKHAQIYFFNSSYISCPIAQNTSTFTFLVVLVFVKSIFEYTIRMTSNHGQLD